LIGRINSSGTDLCNCEEDCLAIEQLNYDPFYRFGRTFGGKCHILISSSGESAITDNCAYFQVIPFMTCYPTFGDLSSWMNFPDMQPRFISILDTTTDNCTDELPFPDLDDW